MTASPIAALITPHGRLLLAPDQDAPVLAEALRQRLEQAFCARRWTRPATWRGRGGCPDRALMCKHVAAVLYGVGARLDEQPEQPEQLFTLRRVDAQDLVARAGAGPSLKRQDPASDKLLEDSEMADVFGLELEQPAGSMAPVKVTGPGEKAAVAKRAAVAKKAVAAKKAVVAEKAVVAKKVRVTKKAVLAAKTVAAKNKPLVKNVAGQQKAPSAARARAQPRP